MAKKIGMFLGKEIIEDNSVKEIRLPSDFIEILQYYITFVKADDWA